MRSFCLRLARRFVNSIPGFMWSNGTLKLIFDGRFYKIGFCESQIRIRQEISNCMLLEKTTFKDYLPMIRYEENNFVSYLVMPLMQNIFASNGELRTLLEDVSRKDVGEQVRQSLLSRLQSFVNNEEVAKELESFSDLTIDVGTIHGDLHRWNVLRDNVQMLKLIDFDLVDEKWCRSFDLINIFISDLIIREGKSWKESFFILCSNLDRIEEIDPKWLSRPTHYIKFDLCSYFLKRSHNENEAVSTDEWKKVTAILDKELERH